MTPPALVVLAAGRSTRYGTPKQLEIVGPNGATLIDYSIFDARRAGFENVAIVVSRELEREIGRRIVDRWRGRVEVQTVRQAEPLGTADAVLAARAAIDGPFAVVNGDDFYGGGSFEALSSWIRGGRGASEYAVVTFRLADTLPASGAVNRAVVRASRDGWVEDIREAVALSCGHPSLPPDTPVSMNLWGLTPAVFPHLAAAVRTTREGHAPAGAAECRLPDAIGDLVRRQKVRVRAIVSGERWNGLTSRSDLAGVRAFISGLVAAGEYPYALE